MGMKRFVRISVASAGAAAATQTAAWIASRRAGRVNVVDVAWGPGLVAVATVSAALGQGSRLRRGLMTAPVIAWGARLAVHVHRSATGRGEDPRYEHMLAGSGPGRRFFKVFVTQGASQWLVGLPMQISAATNDSRSRAAMVGLLAGTALMIAGGTAEAVADTQKARWKSDPDRGPVMDRGLWSLTRHPNYLGDAVFWWGNYLAAASGGPARWAVISPAAMTYFLTIGTGGKPAERLREGDSAYADYQRRVPFFLPRITR